MSDKRKALTAKENAEQTDLPDLARFYKNRSRNEDLINTAKALLIRGVPQGLVALMLRLPLDKVQQLHSEGWNPRCRRVASSNVHTNQRMALTSFQEGESLTEIAKALGLPLYSIVSILRTNGIADAAIQQRLPPISDPMMIEYLRVCERKANSSFNPIKLYSTRKLHSSTVEAATKAAANKLNVAAKANAAHHAIA